MAKSWLIMSTKVLLRVSLLWMKSKSSFISKDKVAPVNQKPQISKNSLLFWWNFSRNTQTFFEEFRSFDLFVTSKNEITNPPIHKLKCCMKTRKPFKTPFNGASFLIYYIKKHFKPCFFHFKGFKIHFAALQIHVIVVSFIWCHEQFIIRASCHFSRLSNVER